MKSLKAQEKRKEREEYVHDIIEQINEGLEQIGITADIAGRPKNIYSIYKKWSNNKRNRRDI